jgi:hypothetical protein
MMMCSAMALALTYRYLRVDEDALRNSKQVLLCELFAGSCILSTKWRDMGQDAVNIDVSAQSAADVKGSILEPRHMLPVLLNAIDIMKAGGMVALHMSPPCNQVSNANTRGPRRLDHTARYILKGVKYARHIAAAYTIENPDSRYNLFYPDEHLDSSAQHHAKRGNQQYLRLPSRMQRQKLARATQNYLRTWYCAWGCRHPKPTLIAVSSPEMASAFVSKGGKLNGQPRWEAQPTKFSMACNGCPHHDRNHNCLNQKVDARFPDKFAKFLAKRLLKEATRLRYRVADQLQVLNSMSDELVARKYSRTWSALEKLLPSHKDLVHVERPLTLTSDECIGSNIMTAVKTIPHIDCDTYDRWVFYADAVDAANPSLTNRLKSKYSVYVMNDCKQLSPRLYVVAVENACKIDDNNRNRDRKKPTLKLSGYMCRVMQQASTMYSVYTNSDSVELCLSPSQLFQQDNAAVLRFGVSSLFMGCSGKVAQHDMTMMKKRNAQEFTKRKCNIVASIDDPLPPDAMSTHDLIIPSCFVMKPSIVADIAEEVFSSSIQSRPSKKQRV